MNKKQENRFLALCAAIVLIGLLLPFGVFAAWDKALLAGPHTQTAAAGLGAQAVQNHTACVLYDSLHITGVDIGFESWQSGGWQSVPVSEESLHRAQNALQRLAEAGLLPQSDLPKAEALMQNSENADRQTYTAPGGLIQIESKAQEPLSGQQAVLCLILTGENGIVYFNYQNGEQFMAEAYSEEQLQAYAGLAGVQGFTDWQLHTHAGAARALSAYSEAAQVYLVCGSGYSITLAASSMLPQTWQSICEAV